jgi:hypothetical protein
MLMFYDFAPHGDGANDARPPLVGGEREHLALCLLFVPECMIPRVVVVVSDPLGA